MALTRATANIYTIESDTGHPLFGLLDLTPAGQVKVEAKQSSLEDWQKEARKLELQGKQEQAEAIRRGILTKPSALAGVRRSEDHRTAGQGVSRRGPGGKPRQQLFEVATCHDEPVLAAWLVLEAGFDAAKNFAQQRMTLGRKSYAPYFARHFKDILHQCDSTASSIACR